MTNTRSVYKRCISAGAEILRLMQAVIQKDKKNAEHPHFVKLTVSLEIWRTAARNASEGRTAYGLTNDEHVDGLFAVRWARGQLGELPSQNQKYPGEWSSR